LSICKLKSVGADYSSTEPPVRIKVQANNLQLNGLSLKGSVIQHEIVADTRARVIHAQLRLALRLQFAAQVLAHWWKSSLAEPFFLVCF
jgi:hypothetical protein